MEMLVLACYYLLVLVPTLVCSLFIQKPILSIEMSDAGLHRELIYNVQFGYPLSDNECEYILEQEFPAAVYVSVDQLNDLKRLKKLNSVYPEFVDIEVSTERAEPFTVLVKGIPKTMDSIKLPIHFRYHAPNDKSTHVIVNIPIPAMYMNCLEIDNELITEELQTTPHTRYCLDEHSRSFTKYLNDSNDLIIQNVDCVWKLISVNYQLKAPLNAKIPVGNQKSFPLVLYATIILSWIVSLWTVFRTHNIPRRINQKLEEQRVLQNKIK